ncbi:MAG TPA: hypothetical protein VF479_06530 [Pseudolysinimonas sp.]
MITSEEPPVVELEELLDDQKEADASRTARQIALIMGLSVVGLAGVAVLATMLVPLVADVTRWVVSIIRYAQGS